MMHVIGQKDRRIVMMDHENAGLQGLVHDIPLAALANNMLNVRLDLLLALNYVECMDRKPTYARTSSIR